MRSKADETLVIVDFSYILFELIDCVKRKTFKLLIDRYRSLARFVD